MSPASAPRLDPEALEQVLIDALEVLPGATLVEQDDWVQLVTPSSPIPAHNKILRARLDPAEMDRRIARVRDAHLARGAGLMWIVGPGSAPHDLSDRLDAAGIELLAPGTGMVLAVPAGVPDAAPGISLRPATRADAELAGDLTARGWGRSASFGTSFGAWMLRSLDTGRDDLAFWLGELDGEPVGCCVLRFLPSVGYLQGASVLPHARGRGVYRAMTWKRMELLRQRGISSVVLWANDSTSAPIARKMGFQAVCTARFHELPMAE